MKLNKKTIILLLAVLFTGCAILFPVPRKYSYATKEIGDPASAETIKLLDTTGWYVCNFGESVFSKINYHLLGFRPGRRLLWMNISDTLTLQSIARAVPDTHCYIIEKNVLKTQVYVNSKDGFSYWQGRIFRDSIEFFRINNIKQRLVYYKVLSK